jgi:hypothetical protein
MLKLYTALAGSGRICRRRDCCLLGGDRLEVDLRAGMKA